jgi:hypothetical protein
MILKNNQAALILELSDQGEINVYVDSPAKESLALDYCQMLAIKLIFDEKFRENLKQRREDLTKHSNIQ